MARGGGLLVPLLTAGAATAAAVVAYRYAPRQYAMAAAAWRYRGRSRSDLAAPDDDHRARPSRQSSAANKAGENQGNGPASDEAARNKEAKKEQLEAIGRSEAPVVTPMKPRSSPIMAMLLQDGSLLVSMFGLALLVVVLLVSLAVVSMSETLQSPNELQMFTPLICTSLAMVLVGMLNFLLRPSVYASPPMARPQPKEQQIVYASSSARQTEADDQDLQEPLEEPEERPKKRVSKCPFGFG